MAVGAVGAGIPKLVKADGKPASDIEKQIATALQELESSSEIKAQLRELYVVGAQEIDAGQKKAVIVWVPYPQLRLFQKVQQRLVRELEKKLNGKHVVFIAKRRILPKPLRGKARRPEKQKRPRSRTLTSVHEAILNDLVFPAEIVGKRTSFKLDGKKVIKAHLDKAQQTTVEHKVDTFASIYKKLTRRDVAFEFPEPLF